MNYSATIEVDDSGVYEIFKAEDQVRNERAKWNVHKKGDKTFFLITAKDSIALRAVFNTITKSLTVYEKLKNELE